MKIEKNKAIPENIRRGGCIYPFRSMEIGDSVFQKMPEGAAMYTAARVFKKRNQEFNMIGRKVEENGIIGYRVWRTP